MKRAKKQRPWFGFAKPARADIEAAYPSIMARAMFEAACAQERVDRARKRERAAWGPR